MSDLELVDCLAELDSFNFEFFFLQVDFTEFVVEFVDLVVFRFELQLSFADLFDKSLVWAVSQI